MADKDNAPPRVFISYSWTNDDHTEWVADLGEKLMTDGVDVVLDQWSLEDGHDVNAFMEKMVTDPTIQRVIVISDKLYAEKADGRRGGVGTETQIISKGVYESVEQNKFVPIVREREDGKACLPVYLKTRKYIDFSDPDNESDAYDQLLRNIFDRPRRKKPTIGKAPSHLFDDEATVVTSAQKAKRFCDFVTTGKGNVAAAFEDFSEEFLTNLEELRMVYSRDEQETWCERIRANIESASAHRDVFVDVVRTGVAYCPADQFMPSLLGLLERILPLQERPEGVGSFFECSEDNYKLLCYEFFLYSVAACVKAKKYTEARQLIDHRYVAPRTFGGNELDAHSFSSFNTYATPLEQQCANVGDRKRYSVMADLVHDRATNKHIRFSEILQADVLLWIASDGYGWFPRCLIYSRDAGRLELFVRAVNLAGFAPLGQILNMTTPQELVQKLQSPDIQKTLQQEMFWFSLRGSDCMNLNELQQCWPTT